MGWEMSYQKQYEKQTGKNANDEQVIFGDHMYSSDYVEWLERRLERQEKWIRNLCIWIKKGKEFYERI